MPRRRLILGAVLATGLAAGAALWWRATHPEMPSNAVPPYASAAASAAHPLKSEQLEQTIARMRERVKASPDDATAWAMLAHSQDMLGRYADAGPAYERLVALRPRDAQVLADAADSMAQAQGGRLQGQPMQWVQQALVLDAANVKALSLAATDAFERKDLAAAIGFWERAKTQVHDAASAQEIGAHIAAARTRQARAASGAGDTVRGRIVLAAGLKALVAAGDTLFVFARPAEGSRMPVALMRRRAGELPLEFELDDSMAMVPQAKLSLQSRVIVGARISRRGDATSIAGDLQGFSAPVDIGTRDLVVEIAEVVK